MPEKQVFGSLDSCASLRKRMPTVDDDWSAWAWLGIEQEADGCG
jgi:hypothetical protein